MKKHPGRKAEAILEPRAKLGADRQVHHAAADLVNPLHREDFLQLMGDAKLGAKK